MNVGQPDFADSSHSVACTLRAAPGALHVIFNAYWEPLDFELPLLDDSLDGWRRIVDTSLDAPHDLSLTFSEGAVVATRDYRAAERSIVIMAARLPRRSKGKDMDRDAAQ